MIHAPKPTSVPGTLTAAQATRATFWARLLMLLAVLVTQMLTVTAVVWNDRQDAERVMRAEATTTLDRLAQVAAETVRASMQPPLQIVDITTELIRNGQLGTTDSSRLSVAFQTMLNAVPQLNGVLIGHDDGRFTVARRGGPDDSGRYLSTIGAGPAPRAAVTVLDARGRTVSRRTETTAYDPRARPWYTLAMATPGTSVWTPPYIFASTGRPGVTVARALRTAADGTVVVGADVQLRQVESFLQGVAIGGHGRVFVADAQGHVIATSRAWPVHVTGHVPTLTEVADPALRALIGPNGQVLPGARQYTVERQAYSAVVRSIALTPDVQWRVGVYAPVDDFTAGLQRASHVRLVSIVLACELGGLLVWPLLDRAVRPIRTLHRQATTDPLTGLQNRGGFLAQLDEILERAQTATQSGRCLGVAIFDLDGFKAINDTYGHPAGDSVLLAVGARLLAAARPGDLLGRLGGDEFALLVDGATREEVQLRVEGMVAALARRPVTVDGVEHPVRSTAGLAFYDPEGPQTTPLRRTAVMARADTALIRGKRRVKGRVWVDGESSMSHSLL